MHRPFKAPLYPLVPIAVITVSLGLLASRFLIKEVSVIDMQIVAVLSILVLLSYYLRMVGRARLKVAVGGISLGIGVFGILISYVVSTCKNWPAESNIPQTSALSSLIFISVISIIAGVLNISTKVQKSFPFPRSERKKGELLRDTIREEKLKVCRIARKIDKHFSGPVIFIGILFCALPLWSILISDGFFNLFKVAVFGIIGVTNIICGVLLLEK